MEQVKAELAEILLALVKGFKILIVYIIPSILLSIVFIPNLGTMLLEKPELLLPSLINTIILALVTYFSPKVIKLQEKVQDEPVK